LPLDVSLIENSLQRHPLTCQERMFQASISPLPTPQTRNAAFISMAEAQGLSAAALGKDQYAQEQVEQFVHNPQSN